MGIRDFFRRIFKESDTADLSDHVYSENGEDAIMIDTFALFAAVEFAASLMANCEFRTYYKGKEKKEKEWARLNYRPNKNQTAGEFWREYFCKLFYEGEALAVEFGEDLIIADSFFLENRAIAESYFTQVSRGSFQFEKNFDISDVLFLKYENESVKQLRAGLLGKYNTLCADLVRQCSTENSKGILSVPSVASGDKDFENRYKDLMENRFKSFFRSDRNAVLPLWGGMTYTPVIKESRYGQSKKISDITNLFTDAQARAAIALKISPVLMKGEVAGIKEALDLTLTILVDPVAKMISELLTIREFTVDQIAKGSRIVADTARIKHFDIFDNAANIDKLIASGYYCIDEARLRAGDQPIGEEWAKRHYITKNYEIAEGEWEKGEKGGEKNEEMLENAADAEAEGRKDA